MLSAVLLALVLLGLLALAGWTICRQWRVTRACREYAVRGLCPFCGGSFLPWQGTQYSVGDGSFPGGPVFTCAACGREARVSHDDAMRGPSPCCRQCGYLLLENVAGRCPECGKPVDEDQKHLLEHLKAKSPI